MSAYAGIGSRETPDDVLALMEEVGCSLAVQGWTLRSGNAPGADQAFARGHLRTGWVGTIELYLPWGGFEAEAIEGWESAIKRAAPQPEAYWISRRFHPNWAALKAGGRALQARNVHQVLGVDVLNPMLSKFVVCWTPGGRGSGGTGQALRIATYYEVPIFDLAIPTARERVEMMLR